MLIFSHYADSVLITLVFILAGASAVAIGTANFVNPRATLDVLAGMERIMTEQGVGDIKDLVGKVIAG